MYEQTQHLLHVCQQLNDLTIGHTGETFMAVTTNESTDALYGGGEIVAWCSEDRGCDSLEACRLRMLIGGLDIVIAFSPEIEFRQSMIELREASQKRVDELDEAYSNR